MTSIGLYGAYAIGGLGSLVGAVMMGIAHTDSAELRIILRSCLWAFVIVGLGLGQFAFVPGGTPWSIMVGAQSALIGTALFAWSFARLAGWRLGCSSLWIGLPLLAVALAVAAWMGGIAYHLVFHSLCLAVAMVMAIASRSYLLRPRNTAERAVGITMVVYAATWAYGLVATLQNGPMHPHMMNVHEPLLSLYAATYALMPMVVGSLVLNLVNAQLRDQVRELAETDELTGLLSRRGMKSRFPDWHSGTQAAGGMWALLVDIDHFKAVNDAHGHDLGDRVLQHIALLLKSTAGSSALVSRHGGEEFLILARARDVRECQAHAERMRAGIAKTPFATSHGPLRVTVSIGFAPLDEKAGFSDAIRAADRALYEAKAAGRNCIVHSRVA